jgi:hypothetical protein
MQYLDYTAIAPLPPRRAGSGFAWFGLGTPKLDQAAGKVSLQHLLESGEDLN